MVQFHNYNSGETKFVIPGPSNLAIENVLRTSPAGGFTKSRAIGAWHQEQDEPVNVYHVAGLDQATLEIVANMVLDLGETDFYVALPNGKSGWFNREDDKRYGPSEPVPLDPPQFPRKVPTVDPHAPKPAEWHNGTSPGSDYPDDVWLTSKAPGTEFEGKVPDPVSPIYNTPDAYRGVLS